MSESNGELTELLCTQMAVNAPAELIVHKRVALVSVKPVCRFIYFYQGIIVFFIFVCFIRFPYDGMIVLVIHITVILIDKAVVVVNAQLLIYRLLRNGKRYGGISRPFAVFVQYLIGVDKYRRSGHKHRVVRPCLNRQGIFLLQSRGIGFAPFKRVACRDVHLNGGEKPSVRVRHSDAEGNIVR